jgi:hypothetical protein
MDNISILIALNTALDKLTDAKNGWEEGLLTAEEAEQQMKAVARVILLDELRAKKEDPFSFENVSKMMKTINKTLYGVE